MATVSAVTNETRFVAAETKAGVLKAIAELNYQRDGIARSLRRSQTGTIGAPISDITNPFFSDLIKGVDHIVHNLPERGNVILCNTEEDPLRERFYLDLLMEKRIDGLIVAPAGGNEAYFAALVARSFPLVLVDRTLPTVDSDSVLVDNFGAATEVVRHLVERGHRRIAMLKATLHATSIADRILGYQSVMQEAGLAALPELIVESASDVDAAHAAGRRILDLDPLPDAVFCTNNFMTLGLMRALHERGLGCPEDVAIAGFDDFQWADSFRPRITAVAQPAFEIGREAARLLVARIAKTMDRPAVHRVLATSLIIRESSL